MPRPSSFVLTLALMAFAPAAHAATAQQSCESAMELASSKYAQCRLTAESKYSKSLDAAKRTAALTKCSTRLGDAFAKATSKYGMDCAATEPSTAFDAYLQQCSDNTVAAAGGAGLPGPSCEADLAACEGELAACESPLSAHLLRTGQVTSYGTGSDGDLQKGVAPAYVDNGDGTVSDTKTGLVWEKKSDDGSIHDKDDVYTLGLTIPLYTLNGTAVTTFLATLNGGGGFAGHTDWRLPNLTELESLRNLQNVNPAVAAVFNTNCGANSSGNSGCTVTTCSCTTPDIHWSSSTYVGAPELAWGVSFGDGSVDSDYKDVEYYVRAVRGGS